MSLNTFTTEFARNFLEITVGFVLVEVFRFDFPAAAYVSTGYLFISTKLVNMLFVAIIGHNLPAFVDAFDSESLKLGLKISMQLSERFQGPSAPVNTFLVIADDALVTDQVLAGPAFTRFYY